MKKIVIIGARHSGTKNDPVMLADSLRAEGAEVTVVRWEDIVFSIETGNVQLFDGEASLFDTAPDLVIAVGWYKSGRQSMYRDVAYAVALFLEARGIAYWNTEMGQQRSTSKLSCMVQLALEGISVPKTRFCLEAASAAGYQALPFVAKAAAASRGEANYLIKNEENRSQVIDEGGYFLVQPFLPNDHDLRVICFGGKPALVLRRSRSASAATHLNNTSQGGSAEWLELGAVPSELLTNAARICKIMNREMAGIDFIPDASSQFGYSCLEVNAIPQLTSGHDVEKKLAAFARTIAHAGNETI